jgi:dUTP pyrophosphatase
MIEPVRALCASINGINSNSLRSAITSGLPDGWICESVCAFASVHGDTVVVHATIGRPEKPGQYSLTANSVGVLTQATPPGDLVVLAMDIVREASAKIRIARGGIRIALAPGAVLPARATEGASGYDLCALGDVRIEPGRVSLIDTGVMLEMPVGMEAQVRPRSGMSKRGIVVPLGTVDADYRGSVGVIAINHTTDAWTARAGDRVAQLVFAAVAHPPIEIVDASELGQTARGAGGFGSTGK